MQMRPTVNVSRGNLIAVIAAAAVAAPAFAADPAPEMVSGTWQHHQDSFHYYGLTSLFSCSSIEDDVKQILLYLGARKDLSVHATGCPGGVDRPGRTADVRAEFYTLEPAADSATPGAISAQWKPVELSPRHPYFVGDGDCELFKAMQDFVPKNFSLRDLHYVTDCVPYQLTINGFSVKAAVLQATPAARPPVAKVSERQ